MVTAIVAPNINEIQTDNFYFTIIFDLDEGSSLDPDGFSLSNIEVLNSRYVSISDLALLYVEGTYAIVAVDVPNNVSDKLKIRLTGTVSVVTGEATSQKKIKAKNKVIKYDTTNTVSEETYNTTPVEAEPTIVILTLSAASVQNRGIVIAQFDFDYSVPHFNASYVTVSPGATKSKVSVIDDDYRRWIMLVTVPASGKGKVKISVDQDALDFPHDAVQAEVQHQQVIPLSIADEMGTDIASGDVFKAKHTYNTTLLNRFFTIKGDHVNAAWIEGPLDGFHHHYDSTTGRLYVRSTEKVTSFPDEFTIHAMDNQNEIKRRATYELERIGPVIVVPSGVIEVFYGTELDIIIEIRNSPTEVKITGAWVGLKYEIVPTGVRLFGYTPQRGSVIGQAIPGKTSGNLRIEATSPGLPVDSALVPWRLESPVEPSFETTAFSSFGVRGQGFTETIEVVANPAPQISLESGNLPNGLSLSFSRSGTTTTVSFTGNFTTAGSFSFKLRAENSQGAAISPSYSILVYKSLVAPSKRITAKSQYWLRQKTNDFPLNIRTYFNRGRPPGVFSISGANRNLYEITDDGIITLTDAGKAHNREAEITVICTNLKGSYRQLFGIYLHG